MLVKPDVNYAINIQNSVTTDYLNTFIFTMIWLNKTTDSVKCKVFYKSVGLIFNCLFIFYHFKYLNHEKKTK